MFQIIRQFTFHKPKEMIQPTVWLFLSQACSMLPAILAYMAIYTLGQAFVPPYTLDLHFLIILAAIGLGSVSYTHLDVYKRQHKHRLCQSLRLHFSLCPCF